MSAFENPALRDEAQGAAQRVTRHIGLIGEEGASTQHSDSPAKQIYRGVQNG
jgi:hypothetical protein